jgi:exoribonuclease R
MLPSSLCNIFGSLKHSENRFAITLKFNINKKGIIDYESIDYEPSFVNTSKCINYEDADKFLNLDGRKLKYIKGFKK